MANTQLPTMHDIQKLDHPVWHALNETHQAFSLGDDALKMYTPEVSAFAQAKPGASADLLRLTPLLHPGATFFIMGEMPDLPAGFVFSGEVACRQMVCPEPLRVEISEKIEYLNNAHVGRLSQLVNLVQPGYFKPQTHLMGDYFGIFRAGELVAAAGERMRMHGFTEISAIVTRPGFTGQGFASQLTAYVANKNRAKHSMPFLHVAAANTHAIRLYEKLGFEHRRSISLWKLQWSG